jgi:WD40 repeat protein
VGSRGARPVGEPLAGYHKSISAAAAGVLGDGQRVAVTGDLAGAVLLWDLDWSQPIDELTAHSTNPPVAAVVTTLGNDQPVLVTADENHLVTIWDLASMSPIERIRLAGKVHGVTARRDDLILAGDRGMLALRIGPDWRTGDD